MSTAACTCIGTWKWSDIEGNDIRVVQVYDPDCPDWHHRLKAEGLNHDTSH